MDEVRRGGVGRRDALARRGAQRTCRFSLLFGKGELPVTAASASSTRACAAACSDGATAPPAGGAMPPPPAEAAAGRPEEGPGLEAREAMKNPGVRAGSRGRIAG